MKNPTMIADEALFSVADIGPLAGLGEYGHRLPNGQDVPGKLFVGKLLRTSGMELSFQTMPPHTGMPFFHKHNEHEELYIFLQGHGEFLLDKTVVPVKEGSVVRVAPQVARSWKNTGNSNMVLVVVQAKAGSLEKFFGEDGILA